MKKWERSYVPCWLQGIGKDRLHNRAACNLAVSYWINLSRWRAANIESKMEKISQCKSNPLTEKRDGLVSLAWCDLPRVFILEAHADRVRRTILANVRHDHDRKAIRVVQHSVVTHCTFKFVYMIEAIREEAKHVYRNFKTGMLIDDDENNFINDLCVFSHLALMSTHFIYTRKLLTMQKPPKYRVKYTEWNPVVQQ